ncbi:lymphocyte antigen 86 isoform X3 [Pleurodeles waltl]|uniref:lymphocyte antigen 86 isoform X3 n=1 Tax=Pleurodeles waltl TaxID=8319 RepID=UPI0037095218
MKVLSAVLCSLLMVSLMESKEWPLHTFCKTDHFEASYKSCDPLQDIGFSIDPCYLTAGGENMKIAVLLRRDINALFLHINGFIRKLNVFSTILTLCELDHPKFTFCGAKKGEMIFYDRPLKLGIHDLPKGEFLFLLELYNEDQYLIGCINMTMFIH